MHRGRRITLNFGGRTLMAELSGILGIVPRFALVECKREQGGAADWGQFKLSGLHRGVSRSRFLAPRPYCHADRRDKRGGDPAHGGFRAVRSAIGGRHVAVRQRRHRSHRRRGRTFSAAGTATDHRTRTWPRMAIYRNDDSDRRGNFVARRRNELGDRPLADGDRDISAA
jgi:hypothetical protein